MASKYVFRHEELISTDGFLERIHETVNIMLRRCPFCGEKAAHSNAYDEEDEEKEIIMCTQCEARTANFDTLEEAVDAWNQRV